MTVTTPRSPPQEHGPRASSRLSSPTRISCKTRSSSSVSSPSHLRKPVPRALTHPAFDETDNYFIPNKVFSVLLGDAVPPEAHGSTNDTEFSHYSILATVEENWSLGSLGLNDQKASAFY